MGPGWSRPEPSERVPRKEESQEEKKSGDKIQENLVADFEGLLSWATSTDAQLCKARRGFCKTPISISIFPGLM